MNSPASGAVRYELAKPHHGVLLAQMSRRLIEAGLPWWNWTPKRVTKAIRSSDIATVIAKDTAHIVGFALMRFGDENAHLNLMAVEPEFQRHGVGSGLLDWLEESCSIAGIVRITLECRAGNHGAIRFYRANGFAIHSEAPKYYCGRESALRMEKNIGAIAISQI